ncbi:MAG: [FeFe] hydrogenase H-cluster radical SAM maturase HydE [Christensenellales bacterium]|jgi:biotin synthase
MELTNNALRAMSREELTALIKENSEYIDPDITRMAAFYRDRNYGPKVFFRGLIEFTNYCRNDCYYCGINRSNKDARRYRLSDEEILECCRYGYSIGLRTFVLQGGDDAYFTTERLCSIVASIRSEFPDCAVTLSVGELSKEAYQALYDAGAARYLLRHETADAAHYALLHPGELKLSQRKQCLFDLKEIGFQVGAGFMIGSPFQTDESLAEDLLFLKELEPHMVGIGPFIPHASTRFKDYPSGSVQKTLLMISLVRIMLPSALIPATTALGTADPFGRELGMRAGANVVMPNLSPKSVREDYLLYDGKICTDEEAAECIECLKRRIQKAGFEPDLTRGDHSAFGPTKAV